MESGIDSFAAAFDDPSRAMSAADRLRVFQEFATLDLLSQGRAEIVVGRGFPHGQNSDGRERLRW